MERIIKTLAVLSVLLLATSASALALSVSDVDLFDEFKAIDNIANDDDSEKAWIAGQYGFLPEEISFTKWDNNDGWTPTDDDASAHYFDFGTGDQPFAFLIKGQSTDDITWIDTMETGSHVLFTNLADLQYGLVDFDWMLKSNGRFFDLETVSHTSAGFGGGGGGGGGDPIPEPSTFILLGAGLAGLAFYRRKKN